MADDGQIHPAIEFLPELLEALEWCGQRIAQGLQEASAGSDAACGAPVHDVAAGPPAAA